MPDRDGLGFTHRPLSSSFLWFIFRILQGNPKKELLRGLWVDLSHATSSVVGLSVPAAGVFPPWRCHRLWNPGFPKDILGGSWIVISGLASPQIQVLTIATLLLTPLITTREPPSRHHKRWPFCVRHRSLPRLSRGR